MAKVKRTYVLLLFGLILSVQLVLWYGLGVRTIGKLSPMAAVATLGKGIVSAGTLLWAGIFLATMVVGRMYCGWLCLFGWYFDLVEKYRKRFRVKLRTLKMPVLLSSIKYMFLAVVLYRALLQPLSVRWPSGLSLRLSVPAPLEALPPLRVLFFLALTLAMTLLIGKRAWCKYVCPTGVALRIAGHWSVLKIRLSGDCISCSACDRACPQSIQVMQAVRNTGHVNDGECINCADCAHACPTQALRLSFPGR